MSAPKPRPAAPRALHWRWFFLGGALTGYGLHWSQTASGPFRLVLDLGIALGVVPALLVFLERRAQRDREVETRA